MMKTNVSPKLPQLTDDHIAERLSLELGRGNAIARESLRRRTALYHIKVRATEHLLELRRKQHGPAAEHAIALLSKELERYRRAERDAQLDEKLQDARNRLPLLPSDTPAAYGRVVDREGHAREKVEVQIVSADGKVVAKTLTDAAGYFAVAAPNANEDAPVLRVADDPAMKPIAFSSKAAMRPAMRVTIESEAGTRAAPPPEPATPAPRPKPSPSPAPTPNESPQPKASPRATKKPK